MRGAGPAAWGAATGVSYQLMTAELWWDQSGDNAREQPLKLAGSELAAEYYDAFMVTALFVDESAD